MLMQLTTVYFQRLHALNNVSHVMSVLLSHGISVGEVGSMESLGLHIHWEVVLYNIIKTGMAHIQSAPSHCEPFNV